MNQVERISAKLKGGDDELAKLCAVHRSQVSRWKTGKGLIPTWHHQKVLDGAKGTVTPHDFFDSEAA